MTSLVPALLVAALALGTAQAVDAQLPVEVQEMLQAATVAELPVEVLEAKAREGLAKGVAEARLLAVLQQLEADLVQAASLLEGQAHGSDREELLEAAVAGERAGLSDTAVLRLAGMDLQVRARALYAAADLVRQGFSEGDALRLVQAAANSDDPLAALGSLATAASTLVAAGLPLPSAVERLATEVSTGKHPLANVPPQSRSDLPEPAQNAPGKGPKGPK